MNLSRLLVLAAVFSGLFSVSSEAAAGRNMLCRNLNDFKGGEVIEAKVSLAKDWPSLTVVTFLDGKADGSIEVEDFVPAKTDVDVTEMRAIAKGYESSLSPIAKLTIDLSVQSQWSISSILLEGTGATFAFGTYLGKLHMKRGFASDADIEMVCGNVISQ